MGSEIEHIWQMVYRFGFYRGGPVLMSALAGVGLIVRCRKMLTIRSISRFGI